MGTTCSRFFADAVDETHDEYTNMQAVTDAATVEMAPISSRSAEARILPASQRSTSSTKPSAASVKVRTKEEEAVATKIDQFSEMFKRLEEKEEDLLNNIHLKSKELDEIKARITKQRDAINQKKLNMVVTHLLAKYKRVKNDLDIYQKQLTSVQHIIQTQHTIYISSFFLMVAFGLIGVGSVAYGFHECLQPVCIAGTSMIALCGFVASVGFLVFVARGLLACYRVRDRRKSLRETRAALEARRQMGGRPLSIDTMTPEERNALLKPPVYYRNTLIKYTFGSISCYVATSSAITVFAVSFMGFYTSSLAYFSRSNAVVVAIVVAVAVSLLIMYLAIVTATQVYYLGRVYEDMVTAFHARELLPLEEGDDNSQV